MRKRIQNSVKHLRRNFLLLNNSLRHADMPQELDKATNHERTN